MIPHFDATRTLHANKFEAKQSYGLTASLNLHLARLKPTKIKPKQLHNKANPNRSRSGAPSASNLWAVSLRSMWVSASTATMSASERSPTTSLMDRMALRTGEEIVWAPESIDISKTMASGGSSERVRARGKGRRRGVNPS